MSLLIKWILSEWKIKTSTLSDILGVSYFCTRNMFSENLNLQSGMTCERFNSVGYSYCGGWVVAAVLALWWE